MSAVPKVDLRLPEDLKALVAVGDPRAAAVGEAVAGCVLDRLDPQERRWVAAIEQLRVRVDASDEQVSVGLPNRRGITKYAPLGDISRLRSKKEPWGKALMMLVRRLEPNRVVELGSCVGISAAYLAAGLQINGAGTLVTLEGAAGLAERARRHLEELGLRQAEVVTGLFADTLGPVLQGCGPVDLAFIDGHHDETATQQYFQQILPSLSEGAVVVFDDIAWSDGMARAWLALQRHPAVRAVVDLERVGICVVGSGEGVHRFALRPPYAMADQVRRAQVAGKVSPEPLQRGNLLDDLPVARLNWGSGGRGEPGWLNSDLKGGPGIQLAGDIRDGLALPDGCLEYVVSIHALSMLPMPDLVPALAELRRVLKPGGTLRLGLPDLARGLAAWSRGDRSYFLVPDEDASTISGKLITQLLWYGHNASLFNPEWIEELLLRAGFARVEHCRFKASPSGHSGITDLDNREPESLYVEAVR